MSHATYLFVTALYLRPKTRPIPALSTILMVLKAVMLYRQLLPLELLPISRIRVGQKIMMVRVGVTGVQPVARKLRTVLVAML